MTNYTTRAEPEALADNLLNFATSPDDVNADTFIDSIGGSDVVKRLAYRDSQGKLVGFPISALNSPSESSPYVTNDEVAELNASTDETNNRLDSLDYLQFDAVDGNAVETNKRIGITSEGRLLTAVNGLWSSEISDIYNTAEEAIEFEIAKAFSGGTFQARNTSPNGQWEAHGSDVGGVRRRKAGETAWENLPNTGNDADRKVAGVIILDDGSMFALVGNGSPFGRIIEYKANNDVVVLATGLDVFANSTSTGDTSSRTRPVGWMLHFDPTNNLIYACTEDGLYRYNRETEIGEIIALSGESLRGFVHEDAITVGEVTELFVCNRTQGIVKVDTVQSAATTTQLGTPTRAEDGAFTPDGNIVAACHDQGVFRIDSATGTTVDITPSEIVSTYSSTGANGDPVMFSAIDVQPDTGIAILVMINPTHGAGWVYRTTVTANTATSSDWESITHTPMILLEGVGYVTPANRIVGGSASSGPGLTGLQHVSFDRNDRTGNTIYTQGTLVTAKSVNAALVDNTSVTFTSDVENSSLLTMLDVAVSDSGKMVISTADHNSMTSDSCDEAISQELSRLAVSGLGDGFGITVVNETWVFCAADDADWLDSDHSWRYFSGPQTPNLWSSTGWDTYDWNNAPDFPAGLAAIPNGDPPRPASVCGYERTDGVIRFMGAADGIGFVYQDYDPDADTWTDPVITQGAPITDDVISQQLNTARASECTKDGSVTLHILQKTGHVYRSLDQGANVTRIATGSNGPEIAATPKSRTGFLRISNDGTYAVLSNKDGIYLIKDIDAVDPEVVQLSSSVNGPIAFDPINGDCIIHVRGGGTCQLLRVQDIDTETDLSGGTDIASDEYAKYLGDQANQLLAVNDGGTVKIVTLYQGGGATISSSVVSSESGVRASEISRLDQRINELKLESQEAFVDSDEFQNSVEQPFSASNKSSNVKQFVDGNGYSFEYDGENDDSGIAQAPLSAPLDIQGNLYWRLRHEYTFIPWRPEITPYLRANVHWLMTVDSLGVRKYWECIKTPASSQYNTAPENLPECYVTHPLGE